MENVDTYTDCVSNDIAPIINWSNDNFAKITSKKIKKQFETLRQNGYEYEISELDNTPSVLATKNYSSLEEFANNTIFKEQFYKNIIITNNNNIISFKTGEIIPYDEENIELYNVENCSVTITVPFVVTFHNADKYNKKKTNSKIKQELV